MIITISDVDGPRGGNQPLAPGNGYRAVYPVPEGVTPDKLEDLANYLQLVVDPHQVRGVNIDGEKLEIIVEAKPGGKITDTRSLYDWLSRALDSYVANAPAPIPTNGGSTPAGTQNWLPLMAIGGLVLLFGFLMRER